ncbi:hypothetical protein NDU88_006991 [Pleurodeles waltl]|uniref:Uncharacterized protein n=1 Tax=Pleurodeles waltl TaxID=8319 RepID=A0AAV7VS82_PLEWA|nr:hypothetical protein NDU88_006991 [Pleurodeles waltl]
MAKSRGNDWALRKLSEGPEKEQQPPALLPKQLKKVLVYCRDAFPEALSSETSVHPPATRPLPTARFEGRVLHPFQGSLDPAIQSVGRAATTRVC